MNNHSNAELIAQAKEATQKAQDDLLKTFQFVPDDRLNWSPSATARTPVWIVTHCSVANVALAALLRGEPLPLPSDPAEAAALIRAGGRTITDRAEAVQSVKDSTAVVLQALDG